jgi:hypothetical protein
MRWTPSRSVGVAVHRDWQVTVTVTVTDTVTGSSHADVCGIAANP